MYVCMYAYFSIYLLIVSYDIYIYIYDVHMYTYVRCVCVYIYTYIHTNTCFLGFTASRLIPVGWVPLSTCQGVKALRDRT